ncbi:MAG: UPF0182 family protein [Chloroflexia bacterium]|nr:UPF0182 family protein [Chloroflexia bacterium]
MDSKQRAQMLIWLIGFDIFLIVILAANRLFGLLVALLLIEGLVGAVIFLRRTDRWPEEFSLRRIGCWLLPFLLLLLLVVVFALGVPLYTDWLWFQQLGYGSVFTTEMSARALLFVGAWLVGILLLGGNMHLALRWLPQRRWRLEQPTQGQSWGRRLPVLGVWLLAALIGLGLGLFVQARWLRLLKFLQGLSVGQQDPLFGRDLAFYLFELPLLLDLKNVLMGMLVLALGLTALVYALNVHDRRFPPSALAHLSVLGVLFLLVKAWDYQLKVLQLLYSSHGVAFGAGYTDVYARWPAYNIMSVIVLICAALLLVNLWRRTWGLLAVGAGVWLLSLFVLGTLYPALVQSLKVRPSELDLERPYIEHSIAHTLQAYDLQNIEEVDFPVEETLTQAIIRENPGTIDNIRLWDHRPLYDTYGQLQEIRQYYDFVDIDVDRYTLAGDYREVELSLRELAVDQLTEAAQTWVNRHLVYTHGYGVVLSPVSQVCSEGQPCFLIQNIPPESSYPELDLERPEIYYGEDTDNYVIVHTTAREFDYPQGNENVYTRYEGNGGVPVGTFLRRLAFAMRMGDLPILLSDGIGAESRILFHRNIEDRLETIAPFFWYDYDPYPVILEGRIYWIQDAYTYSSYFPYAEPYDGLNYVRNAVKVVIDPYNGTTTFYVVDPDDPIVQVYAGIFPALFRPAEDMPAGLREHWRYPEEIFRLQTSIYATYHMRDPQVFYNKEDLWDYAKEIYADDEDYVDSYYVIMRLPGWEVEEFLLMVPFTPANRDNMIAWMHVQCDGDDYGRLGVFRFPKQSLVYGPFQVENRINQDPVISQQLSLWNQRGSRVLRGNLLVVPIEHSLLYVEPLYLQSESGQIPELRRVTVAYGNNIAMAETLDQALRLVLTGETVVGPEDREWQEIAHSAQEHYEKAQECLQAGDWACYGEELRALETDLETLVRLGEE